MIGKLLQPRMLRVILTLAPSFPDLTRNDCRGRDGIYIQYAVTFILVSKQ